MVIPTMGPNAGANQPSEYPDGEDPNQLSGKQVEVLSAEDRKDAAPLISAFGERAVQKLFSKTW